MAASAVSMTGAATLSESAVAFADAVMIAAVAGYVVFLAHDALRPARRYAHVAGWRWSAALFTMVMLVLNVAVPMAAAPLLGRRSLLPGTALGDLGGFVVGLLVAELVGYWVHRAFHRVGFLWRWFHQLHHSAEQLDSFGAFFLHPNEVLAEIAISLLVAGPLLGLTSDAAGLVGAAGFAMAWFQHANVRTPRGLGFVVHRPESHAVHHTRGAHTGNFGSLAIWDQVFGTFSNPAEAPALAGFYDGASLRVKDMLLGRDVSLGSLGRAGTPRVRALGGDRAS